MLIAGDRSILLLVDSLLSEKRSEGSLRGKIAYRVVIRVSILENGIFMVSDISFYLGTYQ